MPSDIGKTPSKPPRSTSRTTIEITALLQSTPEPTTTISGVVPGRALYDTPELNEQETQPEESERRVPTLTQKGSNWADLRKAFHVRSAKIQNTKARNVRIGKAPKPHKPRQPSKPRKPRKSRKSRKSHKSSKSPVSESAGYLSDEYSACSTMGTTVTDMSTVRGCSHNPCNGELHDCPTAASASTGHCTGTGSGPGADHAATGGGSGCGSGLRSPSAIPGTPGQDPESEHPHPVKRVNPTSTESQYSDYIESLDTATLVAALRKFIEYDPTLVDPAALSTQDIKSLLKVYIADSTPAMGSSKRKAEALQFSQKASTDVDNSDQSGIDEPGPERPAKRHQPRVAIEDDNTDTVDESEVENTEIESEPNTEPPTPAYEPPTSNHPSRSPSPLPRTHVPINSNTFDTLDPPFGCSPHETLGTTQASTQEPVNHPTRSLTRTSTVMTEVSPAQRPPAQSQSVRNQPLASSDLIGPGQRPRTWAQPGQATVRPSALPPTPAAAPRAPRNPTTSHHAESSLRQDKTRPKGSALTRPKGSAPTRPKGSVPTRQEPVDAQALRQAAEFLQFIQDSDKQARVVQERHRRQSVAAAAGVTLSEADLDPPQSHIEHLEKDLLRDDEEERSARAAEEAGEIPTGRKRKPSARDLVGYERQIISAAKMHLFAHCLKEGAIQTHPTFVNWAGESWIKTWCQHLPHLPPQVASSVVKQVLINGLATGRGRFKDPVRHLVEFKLEFIKPALTPEDTNHNFEIFNLIHPNTFHCTEFSPPYGHYESDLVTQAIALTMFSNPNAVGVVHSEFFDPMPLTTVAFVLAIIQFCIEEWETGYFKARDLSMTDLLNKYVAHLRGLKETRIGAKGRMQRLQAHWFEFGYQYSGATPIHEPYYQPITLRTDVRPDTPELEPEISNGRYTARAKGKGRARN